ncbi:TetR family transcriptional regulator, partial [Actinomadura bangladeshensis]|nr:TetR family transcriptional regulator [Actinomadura bangladeshensis]
DAAAVSAAVGAPFYYRLLIQRGPVDDALAETAAAAACAAARSGVFAPPAGQAP